jgi:ParB-like chromosome segregation protein Spo0J
MGLVRKNDTRASEAPQEKKRSRSSTESGVSKALQQSMDNAESLSASWKADRGGLPKPVIEEPNHEDDIPVASIILDEENSRTRHLLPSNPTKNPFATDDPSYAATQTVIDEIIELKEHFLQEPILSSISVYQSGGKFITIYGNRRFLAWKLAFGDHVTIRAKIYSRKPQNKNLLQFIENSQHKSLSIDSEIMDFKAALKDLAGREPAKHPSAMGISKATYYKNIKIIGSDSVLAAVYAGVITNKDVAYNIAHKFKKEADRVSLIQLIVEGKSPEEATECIVAQAEPVTQQPVKTKKRAGRARSRISFPVIKGPEAVTVAKAIINGSLKDMDWEDTDWENFDSIQERLNLNIERLIETTHD